MATESLKNTKTQKMMIGDSEALLSFAPEPNPNAAELVKKALLDSYLLRCSSYKERDARK